MCDLFDSLQKIETTENGEYFLSRVNSSELLKELKGKGYVVSSIVCKDMPSLSKFKVQIRFKSAVSCVVFSFFYSSNACALVMSVQEGTEIVSGSRNNETFIRGFDLQDFKQYDLI